eukprot:scaffold35161_cov64-Phaeocystis_antarctica.AAC.12
MRLRARRRGTVLGRSSRSGRRRRRDLGRRGRALAGVVRGERQQLPPCLGRRRLRHVVAHAAAVAILDAQQLPVPPRHGRGGTLLMARVAERHHRHAALPLAGLQQRR